MEAALDCQRELKSFAPAHYPPTPGQRGQAGPETWGRVCNGVRMASELMGFR